MQPVRWHKTLGPVQFNGVKLDEDKDPFLGSGSAAEVYRYKTNNPRVGSVAAKVYEERLNLLDDVNGLEKVMHSDGTKLKGVVTAYGLAEVPTPKGMQPAFLMKEASADGAKVFDALNTLLAEGRISRTAYDGAHQLVARRSTKTVRALNDKRVTHSDYKPENLLFYNDSKARSELTDFQSHSDDANPAGGGTWEYMPPEVSGHEGHPGKDRIGFEKQYDIYSVGVTLDEAANSTNDGARADFIQKITHSDPQQRLTAEQALAHPYMEKQTGTTKRQSIHALLQAIELAGE